MVQEWKEATLTLAYLPSPSAEIRLEVRGDRSDQRSFVESNGSAVKKDQNSAGVEAIFQF